MQDDKRPPRATFTLTSDGATFIADDGTVYRGRQAIACLTSLTEPHEEFFLPRGIDADIARERGYDVWFAWRPEKLVAAWNDFITEGQIPWVRRVAEQTDGYIMPRYSPPRVKAPPIAPEIRPYEPVDAKGEWYQRRRIENDREPKLGKYLLCPTRPSRRSGLTITASTSLSGRSASPEEVA